MYTTLIIANYFIMHFLIMIYGKGSCAEISLIS